MSLVSLEEVSKKYRIAPGRRERLKNILSFGKSKPDRGFWALKDINLEIEKGTALGILGRNGAGKTTLLQLISGVLQPTSGTVRVEGRIVALFMLGAGFDDEFTGRENIMLNGLLLGIEREEIMERFDEIEAFADIGGFMDRPIKTYSSGMRARLGFAVAVSVEPDIMLVDETLSVGDAVFKAKGIQKMRELRDSGTTILFVSHSLEQVRDFCTEAILIHEGNLVSRGGTSQVIDEYQSMMSNIAAQRQNRSSSDRSSERGKLRDGKAGAGTPDLGKNSVTDQNLGLRHGTGEATIQNVELLDDHGSPVDTVTPQSNLTVRTHVQYVKDVDDSVVNIVLRNEAGLDIFSTDTALEKTPVGKKRAGEQVVVDFTFQVPLKQGRYSIATAISRSESNDLHLDWMRVAAVFKVSYPSDRSAFPGLIHLPTQVRVFEPDRAQEPRSSG